MVLEILNVTEIQHKSATGQMDNKKKKKKAFYVTFLLPVSDCLRVCKSWSVLGSLTATMGNPVLRGAMIQVGFSDLPGPITPEMVKVADCLVGKKTRLDHGPRRTGLLSSDLTRRKRILIYY